LGSLNNITNAAATAIPREYLHTLSKYSRRGVSQKSGSKPPISQLRALTYLLLPPTLVDTGC
jgi:hypothetical protein